MFPQPAPHTLRHYQTTAISDVRQAMRDGHRSVVLQLATGAGKTLAAAEVIKLAVSRGNRVLFLAPRRELISQAHNALKRHGVSSGIIMAGMHKYSDGQSAVQVASFDTLHARAVRSDRMELPPADLVIVDECHLSIAATRKEIIQLYPTAKLIGLTATPARADGRGLGELYDELVMGPSIRTLINEKHLVPMRYFAPTKPDLSKIKLNRDGDYQEKALGKTMNNPKLIGDIIDNWKRLASDRPTVVFCTNCDHSRFVAAAFVKAGFKAEHLDGETPIKERAAILARVESGQTQILCNVYVASYGLDIPRLSCAVLARPTKNITLYLQTLGRVMRPFPGKTDALCIDHSGAVEENGFADEEQPWSLDGKTKLKERKAKAKAEKKELRQITCKACSALFSGQRECPACGYQCVPPAKDVGAYAADLYEIPREAKPVVSMDTKLEFYGQLLHLAAGRNYKEGWVAHKFKEKFKVWPNDPRYRRAKPVPPTPEFTNWVISRRIAASRQKQAADQIERRTKPSYAIRHKGHFNIKGDR